MRRERRRLMIRGERKLSAKWLTANMIGELTLCRSQGCDCLDDYGRVSEQVVSLDGCRMRSGFSEQAAGSNSSIARLSSLGRICS
jgi:hypothetical protein